MRVVLIHPPHPNSTDDRLDPPMGLLYIASHLEKNEIPVEILDLSSQTEWEIPKADFYGITAYVSTLDVTKQIATECRNANPDAKIVIGGAHATARPYDFGYADYVVRGYGEEWMLQVITRGFQGKKPLDLFEFPAYHLVDLSSYSRRIAGKPSVPFLTSRGCPFSCAFCGLSGMRNCSGALIENAGSRQRFCGPSNSTPKFMKPIIVEKQIRRIRDEFNITSINFQDDIFTLNQARFNTMIELLKPLDIKFRCHGRAGYDTKETYSQLASAGCEQVAWGIESGSQTILDKMHKQSTVYDNYNVIQWAKKNSITSRIFLIIGFPGETKETLAETKKFIEWADPDQVFCSSFVPYPGTDVGDNPEKYGITKISHDYNQYYQVSKDGTGGLTIDTEWLSKEEFRELELEFRDWLNNRSMRGNLQDYEIEKKDEKIAV